MGLWVAQSRAFRVLLDILVPSSVSHLVSPLPPISKIHFSAQARFSPLSEVLARSPTPSAQYQYIHTVLSATHFIFAITCGLKLAGLYLFGHVFWLSGSFLMHLPSI
ncbi:hypothetical protein BJ138DRAFT_1157386 [Hygrophoropsis aurantiaca]|uniref:Uncharacterized protein n=1 Tax=Hygrophoropsis aurantiaca TaxID=72124 RepID=A0ACB8A696_9AGAM|nr:hypothetical protein BJ138DRAFT_1157386 [Hygrophoropsis aurantiaca]